MKLQRSYNTNKTKITASLGLHLENGEFSDIRERNSYFFILHLCRMNIFSVIADGKETMTVNLILGIFGLSIKRVL